MPEPSEPSPHRDGRDERAPPLTRAWPTLLLTASIVASWGAVPADALGREQWKGVGALPYLGVGLGLTTSLGVLGGLILCVLAFLDARFVGPRVERFPVRAVGWGVVAGGVSWGTAFELFSGAGIQRTLWATPGPLILVLGAVAFAAGSLVLLRRALRAAERRERGWLAFAGPAGLLVCLCLWADLNVKVQLYPAFHDALKVMSWLLATGALVCGLARLPWRRRVVAGAAIASILALVWSLVCFGSGAVRHRELTAVPAIWLEPIYLGRLAEQVHRWGRPESASPVGPILEAYGVSAPIAAPAPSPLPPPGPRPRWGDDWNLLVIYSDTLRADVTRDAALMPNFARLARQSLAFEDTYAAACRTRLSLHTILTGSVSLSSKGPAPLLRVARRNGLPATVFLAEVPRRYLVSDDPDFTFDQIRTFKDNDGLDFTRLGWGGTVPTDRAITDALEPYLAAQAEPFFLWLLYFDIHQWLHYDDAVLAPLRTAHGIDTTLDAEEQDYRAVVAEWDAQLGRVLDTLERRKLTERTVIVLLADHGEAISYRGLQGHGPFLWEQCMRVPLLLRIPGVQPRVIDAETSLADVTPTLCRLLEPGLSLDDYHGEDLLACLDGPPRPRRYLRTLLGANVSSSFEIQVTRIGVVEGDRKLVLNPDAPLPELYDLGAEAPDDVNILHEEPETVRRLLRRLVDSPAYPPPAAPWGR